jgi:hypothetical protein
VLHTIDGGGGPRRLPVLSLSAVSPTMGHVRPSAEGSEVGLVRGNGGEVVTVKHADSRDGQMGTDA